MQSRPRRARRSLRAISPDYDIETDEDADGGERLNDTPVSNVSDDFDTHSENDQQSNNSELNDITDFDIEEDNTVQTEESTVNTGDNNSLRIDFDDSDDDSLTMPATRRSTRLSQAASLNSTVSSNGSNRAGPSTRSNSPHLDNSSDTEEYEIDNNTPPTIEINDTQVPPADAANEVEDDDDVILIPENIETIDLCTQAFPTPRNFRIPVAVGEVIEIEDSPMTHQQQDVAAPRTGPTRNNRSRENARTVGAPYQVPAPNTSTPYAKRLNLDDSQDGGATQSVKISCPICLESIIGRKPVSTTCGHLFCKQCITAALKTVKKCPMCKKTLKATNFHDIYLG